MTNLLERIDNRLNRLEMNELKKAKLVLMFTIVPKNTLVLPIITLKKNIVQITQTKTHSQ